MATDPSRACDVAYQSVELPRLRDRQDQPNIPEELLCALHAMNSTR
jgi:hypothetical protein